MPPLTTTRDQQPNKPHQHQNHDRPRSPTNLTHTRRFTDLDELNEAVADQVEMINDRTPFRGENRSRRAWFQEMELDELIELPAQRWQQVQWRKAKVSRDWHVQVDTVKYSVPHQHAGQDLDVRIVGEQVDILAGGDIVATHPRGTRRNTFVTDPTHAPAGYEDTALLWTRAYFLRQAERRLGPTRFRR